VILENFTPVAALAGGALIGLSASAMLYFQGRIAGISGIVGGLLTPREGDVTWRLTFLAGLLAGGLVMVLAAPSTFAVPDGRSSLAIVAAGLLVGFGTRMGNGCTSGHGVCGLTRLSPRSAVAVGTFMATGAITATVVGSLLGGAL
jgi:uncharacterized membrane protein YedE/YeeE